MTIEAGKICLKAIIELPKGCHPIKYLGDFQEVRAKQLAERLCNEWRDDRPTALPLQTRLWK